MRKSYLSGNSHERNDLAIWTVRGTPMNSFRQYYFHHSTVTIDNMIRIFTTHDEEKKGKKKDQNRLIELLDMLAILIKLNKKTANLFSKYQTAARHINSSRY